MQYVTVKIRKTKRGEKDVYTYQHDNDAVAKGDVVWIDAMYSGVRPAEVIATSKNPPSRKDPAPDGYSGPVTESTLR